MFLTVRYPVDVYDRIWYSLDPTSFSDWIPISTKSTINSNSLGDAYQVPDRVLKTAARAPNASIPLNFFLNLANSSSDSPCYIYFHFAEIEKLKDGQKRKLRIDLNSTNSGLIVTEPITLEYLMPMNKDSTALPIRFPLSPTNLNDVKAIKDIKKIYNITRNWQGDPCLPSSFSWEGLNCSNHSTPRIISLNLSSSELTGMIATSVSNLESIMFLDLSCNDLTGPLPEFLAQLPNLKMLNLSGNKFNGSVPDALLEKSKNGKLLLRFMFFNCLFRLEEIPGVCQSKSGHGNKKKFIIPVIACTTIVGLLILFSFTFLAISKRHRKRERPAESEKEGSLKSKNRQFTYSEIVHITNNFKTIIGEGGFGKVYLGTLNDDSDVAIKVLSPSSRQGYKEFRAEVRKQCGKSFKLLCFP
ncbi:hypothetical protein Dsin_014019 [Dipteronia sinensis]|uniref:Malectin-like domain-containing protein n=1 Tax=Dipteronia sinensis TaxID=43782 RepID=A0AAE0AMA3_9ROSI|nr:hypothetical protein Dsin_014019 [Dipteronia sinensis]